MKIVLIRPPEINRIWVGIPRFFNDGIFLFPPLGIMQLKAYIEKYTPYDVAIYDSLIYRADYDAVGHFIRKTLPQIVGISTFTHSLVDVVKTAKAVKEVNPSICVVAGGPHTYTFCEESKDLMSLGCIDYVVLGDGEKTFAQLLSCLDSRAGFEKIEGLIYRSEGGKIVKNGNPQFVEDLDSVPFPSRNIEGFKNYYTPASSGRLMTTIITSRGCPYNCKFCNVQKRYRARSIQSVVDEMEFVSSLGFKEVFFIDDTFNVTTERVIRLSEEILRRALQMKWGFKARCDSVTREMLDIARKAGCFRIHYGVETGLDKGLDSIDKRVNLGTARRALEETKAAKIRTVAYFIIGCPHEKDKSDILKTINFATSLPTDFAVFSLLSPYPDAAFYKEGVEKRVFDKKAWEDFIRDPCPNHGLPTSWNEYFSKKELLHFLKIAHRKFYYRPKILFNALLNVHSFAELKRLLAGSLSLLKLELFHKADGGL
jgi:radical SAM superfamily enzyme YgiQ (UPF0313 family)